MRCLPDGQGQPPGGRHLAKRIHEEYKATCERLGRVVGFNRVACELTPSDFERLRKDISKKWGPIRLGNEIQRVRSIFKFAYADRLLSQPMQFGSGFIRPSAKVLRIERAKKGVRMFEREEVFRLLHASDGQLKAMILLGLNCGYGNADVGLLPLSALDLDLGWVRFPRPKTGVDRKCKLWPETVKRLRVAIAGRPEPKDSALQGRVFITKYGLSWHKDTPDNPISKEFRKLLDSLDMHRPGLGFYCLWHGLETIKWNEERLRDRCQEIVAPEHAHPEAIGIVDESGTAKCGEHTVGAARQWLGSRGKVDNGVVGMHRHFYVTQLSHLYCARLRQKFDRDLLRADP